MSTEGYAKSWQDWEAASGGRFILKGDPETIKAQNDGLIAALTPHMPEFTKNVDVKEGDVDGIKYRIYTPKGETGPFPVAIWTHGGGWMVGDINMDHHICGAVSEHTKSAVVNVDYRLTPEHKWPTQLNDSLAVYKWAHANAASFNGDPNRFYTIGGSAGGGLALSIANQILKDPQLKSSIRGIVAFVPITAHWDSVPQKYKEHYKSIEQNKLGSAIIDKESMECFYKGAAVDPHDKTAFTILDEENHKNFPPTYFASCEFDPLRDDATIMEMRLKEVGVPTKHDYYPGFPHYFWIAPGVPEAQQFVGNLFAAVEWIKGQM